VSPDGATARAPTPAFAARNPRRLSPARAASRRVEDPVYTCVGLGRRRSWPRTPSIGSLLDLAIEWSGCAFTFTFTHNRPAPFSLATKKPASSGYELPYRASPRHRSHLSATRGDENEDAAHRLLQPTLRHVHPWTVRFPSAGLSPPLTRNARCCDPPFEVSLSALRAAGAELPCGLSTPSRRALDGAHRASASSLTAALSFLRRAEHRSGRRSHRRGFFRPRRGWRRKASDAPCRAPTSTRIESGPHLRGARTASPAIAFNDSGFPGSERLPSTSVL
jgi:hypothetical protein